jgi:hypothetical protein
MGIVLDVVRELIAAHGAGTGAASDRDHPAVLTVRPAVDRAVCRGDEPPAVACPAGQR